VVSKLPDYVERRIVVEFGRQYAYVYMTTGDGKLIPDREESFKQPYLMERKEAHDDADDLWQMVYDMLNDTINFPTEGDDDGDGRPEE
jgi:hypothetical protein